MSKQLYYPLFPLLPFSFMNCRGYQKPFYCSLIYISSCEIFNLINDRNTRNEKLDLIGRFACSLQGWLSVLFEVKIKDHSCISSTKSPLIRWNVGDIPWFNQNDITYPNLKLPMSNVWLLIEKSDFLFSIS